MSEAGAENLAWADAFVAALAAAGLRHAVLAPGARSAPLAVACLRRPEIECHIINDERAAGFFALGLGKGSGQPAAVLTTSGTAAANLLPAIVEASLADVPLVALTADRPPERLGWGANQTIDQTKLYGDHVRAFFALPPPGAAPQGEFLRALASRLIEAALAPLPGPVHANFPFREPLLPETLPAPPPLPAPLRVQSAAPSLPAGIEDVAARLAGRPGVILCGEARYPAGFAEAVTALAARLAAPLIAEPLANLRFGAHDKSRLIAHAARFLRLAPPPQPEWVLRFGAFPVSRTLERWLVALEDCEHLIVASAGRYADPHWQGDTRLVGDPLAIAQALAASSRPARADFCEAWQAAEAEAAAASRDLPCFEGSLARALLAALPAGAHCFVGNSLAIRAVDAFGGTGAQPLTLYGNRGAAGIDGNLATAAGIAAAQKGPIALFIGDQTLFYDATSLALLAPCAALVVLLDNGGGGIFEQLPWARALPPELLERGWLAPPAVDVRALAAAFGFAFFEAADLAAFQSALARAREAGGPALIRCRIDRAHSRKGFAA
ncbi:MAG: 2-succinyl-5-enolpyruvyl-6-hydroxy-3-cyclohexene-1-carboxylic-acid synthase [Rhodocyclaceae bacterium]|nr:2-succinyl-5-enolpyruvyl-6-hydroxy-3-cyclohexene-1-carboxylic-acid synthase [Rhodocyclaceae bacterium]